jgi:hypothetical protein
MHVFISPPDPDENSFTALAENDELPEKRYCAFQHTYCLYSRTGLRYRLDDRAIDQCSFNF